MCAPMKKRSCAFLLALCLLLTACGCDSGAETEPSTSPVESVTPETEPTPEPTPELSQREQDWREDFAYLKETLVEVHPDPFWCCSEEDFDWKIEHLASRASGLTDSEILFELVRIVGGLRVPMGCRKKSLTSAVHAAIIRVVRCGRLAQLV